MGFIKAFSKSTLVFDHSVVSYSYFDTMDCSPHHTPLSMGSPGKNTGVGCYFLLQGIFLTQGLNQCLLQASCIGGRFFTTSQQMAVSKGRGENNCALEPRNMECFCCTVKSGASCLFDNFSSLDHVFKQVSPFGAVFLQIYL